VAVAAVGEDGEVAVGAVRDDAGGGDADGSGIAGALHVGDGEDVAAVAVAVASQHVAGLHHGAGIQVGGVGGAGGHGGHHRGVVGAGDVESERGGDVAAVAVGDGEIEYVGWILAEGQRVEGGIGDVAVAAVGEGWEERRGGKGGGAGGGGADWRGKGGARAGWEWGDGAAGG